MLTTCGKLQCTSRCHWARLAPASRRQLSSALLGLLQLSPEVSKARRRLVNGLPCVAQLFPLLPTSSDIGEHQASMQITLE